MGNSISVNIGCCRRRQTLKLKIDTSDEIEEYTQNPNSIFAPSQHQNMKQQSQKPSINEKERSSLSQKEENESQESQRKREQNSSKINGSKPRVNFPNIACRKSKDGASNLQPSLKAKYLDQHSQLLDQKPEVLDGQSTSVVTTNIISHIKVYNTFINFFQRSGKSKLLKKRSLSKSPPSLKKSHQQLKDPCNLRQISDHDCFNKRQTEEYISTLDEQFSRSSSFSSSPLKSKQTKISSPQLKRIPRPQNANGEENDDDLYQFDPKKIYTELNEYSIAFDSRSQSACTDLEALNSLNQQLRHNKTNSKQVLNTNSNSSGIDAQLFSPASHYKITTSQDSVDSQSQVSNNGKINSSKTQTDSNDTYVTNKLRRLDIKSKRDHAGERIKDLQSQPQLYFEKQLRKKAKKLKQLLLHYSMSGTEFIRLYCKEQDNKRFINGETLVLFKASQFFKSQSSNESEIQINESVLMMLKQTYSILLKNGRKHTSYLLEAEFVQQLLDYAFRLTKGQHQQVMPVLELTIKILNLIVTSQKIFVSYIQRTSKIPIQMIDLLRWALINANNKSLDLQSLIIQMLTKVIQSSRQSEQSQLLTSYILYGQVTQLLSQSIQGLRTDCLAQNTLYLIKVLTFFKILLLNKVGTRKLPLFKTIADSHQDGFDLVFISSHMLGVPMILKKTYEIMDRCNQQSLNTIVELSVSVINLELRMDLVSCQYIISECEPYINSILPKIVSKFDSLTDSNDFHSSYMQFLTLMFAYNLKYLQAIDPIQQIKTLTMKILVNNQDAILCLLAMLTSDFQLKQHFQNSVNPYILQYLQTNYKSLHEVEILIEDCNLISNKDLSMKKDSSCISMLTDHEQSYLVLNSARSTSSQASFISSQAQNSQNRLKISELFPDFFIQSLIRWFEDQDVKEFFF